MLKPYVSIDIETTGISPDRCQVIEIGAIVDDWVSPLHHLHLFHCYVMHDLYRGEPYALSMHTEIFRRISSKKEGYTFCYDQQVGRLLKSFLEENKIDPFHVLAAGKNFASFDRIFLEKLPSFSCCVRFNHRSYDPGMLFWNPDIDSEIPDTETCIKRAELLPLVRHTALEDALVTIQLMRHYAVHPTRS